MQKGGGPKALELGQGWRWAEAAARRTQRGKWRGPTQSPARPPWVGWGSTEKTEKWPQREDPRSPGMGWGGDGKYVS